MRDPALHAILNIPALADNATGAAASFEPDLQPTHHSLANRTPPGVGTTNQAGTLATPNPVPTEPPGVSDPNPGTSTHDPPKLMTTAQVAAFFDRTERTILNWRKRGLLRARRVGGSVFFLESDVLALLDDGEEEERENANG